MRRNVAWLIGVAVISAFSPGVAGEETGTSPTHHVVEIRDFEFHPSTLVVATGDRIVWVNRDIAPHTATAMLEDAGWDTGTLETDDSWELVVDSLGVHRYLCRFHPLMAGSVDVR